MPKLYKYFLILLILLSIGLSLFGVYFYINNKAEVDDGQIDNAKDSTTSSCTETYTNVNYPNFSFKYDSCKWTLAEQEDTSDYGIDTTNIVLMTQTSELRITVIPFIGFGLDGAVCSDDYEVVRPPLYRLRGASTRENDSTGDIVLVDLYSNLAFDDRTSQFEEEFSKFIDSAYYIDKSKSSGEYTNILLNSLPVEERFESIHACAPLGITGYTDTMYLKEEFPGYFQDEVGNIEAVIWATINSGTSQDQLDADQIMESMVFE